MRGFARQGNGWVISEHGIAPCICGGGRGHDTDVPKILIRHGPKIMF